MLKTLVILLAAAVLTSARPASKSSNSYNPQDDPLVCYFTNWSQYRSGAGSFKPENIDPMLCNVIPYAFVDLTENPYGIKDREWNEAELIAGVMNLKHSNPNLRVTVAIGGWNAGSTIFSDMVSTEETQIEFVDNVITYMYNYGFDGVDLDWEYPSNREGSRPEDKERFTELIHKFRVKFDEISDDLLLTAAVAAGKNVIDAAYQIDAICEELDYLHLMTYDYHGAWSLHTDHNSPLSYGSVEYPEDSDLYYYNMNATAQYYLNSGCPLNKIVLGLPTYGRTFTLADKDNHGYNAAATDYGTAGQYTGQKGILAYYEVCSQLDDTDVLSVWSDAAAAPVLVNGDQWISYDDVGSIKNKLKYAMDLGVAGAMIWSLALDDFSGMCGRDNDLLRSIYEELYDVDNSNICYNFYPTTGAVWYTQPGSVLTTPPPIQQCFYDNEACDCSGSTPATAATTQANEETTSTTTQGNGVPTTTQGNDVPTTASGGSNDQFTCDGKSDGIYPDPNSNTVFHQCANGVDYEQSCSNGLVFDPSCTCCNWP